MPKCDVIILPLAEQDIVCNANYIFYEKKAPETALKLLRGFEETIEKLSFMPTMHEFDEDEDLSVLQIRKYYYKNYKIFFVVDEEKQKVFILRVLHMLVDAKPLLLRMKF